MSDLDLGTSPEGERIERTFEAGQSPDLKVDSHAGRITVRASEEGANQVGAIHVVATKQARRRSDLDRIQVSMTERDGGLEIMVEKPRGLSNSSVDLEIIASPGTRLDLDTGAGSVSVQGLAGGKVHTGAGSITVLNLIGAVKLDSGAGSVTVRGVEGEVDLDTGTGSLDVGIDVAGTISRKEVKGVVGDGSQGSIRAHTGVGSIHLVHR